MTAEHHRRGVVGGRGEGHRLRRARCGVVDRREVERERRRRLDLRAVEVEPLGLVEEHGGDDPPVAPVRRDRVAAGPRPLRELDLVGERRDADGLDVDPELDRPERRHGDVRDTAHRRAQHVVGHDLGLGDGVLPVLQAEELVAVERVGEPRHVAGDEDVVGDEAVDVDGAAPRIGRDAERAGRQPRAVQPLHVPHGAEGDDDHVHVESSAVGQAGLAHPAVALERRHLDPRAEIDAVVALEVGGDLPDHVAERTAQRRPSPLDERHVEARAGGTPTRSPSP